MGFFLVFLIVLLLDFYVFQGIRSYFSTHPSEVFRNLSYILFWGVSIAIPLFFLLGMQEYKTSQQMSRMFVVAGNIWLVLFISKIAFVLVMFGEDAYRLGSAAYTKW
ncbi:MAG TPA: hypothetical protein VFX48_00535, partial [Saprospiraceae bacterium]|nr:hypothetical protein [Saprospiraceae bacterium]